MYEDNSMKPREKRNTILEMSEEKWIMKIKKW